MKTPLRDYGYPPTESVAVLAASAAMGETIPPSLMLLVLGSITTLSVGSLFLAGMLPAAVLALVLIAVVIVRSHMHGYFKGPPFRLGRALRSTPPAIRPLVPVIVVGGIVCGIASPTGLPPLRWSMGLLHRLSFIARLVAPGYSATRH
jgi:TRAP-type C4-dicarboxylate transport system permease large subunit